MLLKLFYEYSYIPTKRISTCKTAVRQSKGKRTLMGTRYGWKDDIRIDLKEKGNGIVNSIYVDQNKIQQLGLLNMVKNLRIP
jgi:hypothetical protein